MPLAELQLTQPGRTTVPPRDGDVLVGGPALSWPASLDLAFALKNGCTVPTQRRHAGPLRTLKHWYPDGDRLLELAVVHPPGGIAGGDSLGMSVRVEAGAEVRLTTPGAGKWYRAGHLARQRLSVSVAEGGLLEWLPLESIVFDGAQVAVEAEYRVAPGGLAIVQDVVCLGRTASGEPFRRGRWRQDSQAWIGDRLVWRERQSLLGDDPMLASAVGLGGQPVFGTLIWLGGEISAEALETARALTAPGMCGLTQRSGIGFARGVAGNAEALREWLAEVWRVVRLDLTGRAVTPPRLWRT